VRVAAARARTWSRSAGLTSNRRYQVGLQRIDGRLSLLRVLQRPHELAWLVCHLARSPLELCHALVHEPQVAGCGLSRSSSVVLRRGGASVALGERSVELAARCSNCWAMVAAPHAAPLPLEVLGSGIERCPPQLELPPQRPGFLREPFEALGAGLDALTRRPICVIRRSAPSTVPRSRSAQTAGSPDGRTHEPSAWGAWKQAQPALSTPHYATSRVSGGPTREVKDALERMRGRRRESARVREAQAGRRPGWRRHRSVTACAASCAQFGESGHGRVGPRNAMPDRCRRPMARLRRARQLRDGS